MPKEFLTDEEINQETPNFIPDSKSSAFFGAQEKPEVKDVFLSGHPILKGISDIVGTTGLGKGIAQKIFLNFTPEGKDLIKQLQEKKITQKDIENVIGKTATTKEVLGSAIQTGATLGTFGLGAPVAKTAVGRIAEVAGKLGGLSAVSGGGKALEKEEPLGEIAKEALISGTIGATFGGVLQSASELTKMVSSSKIAENLYNRAIGVSKKVVEKGKAPGKFLIEEGISGTKSGILSKSQAIANDSESKIAEVVRDIPKRFKSEDVVREIKKSLMKKFGNALTSNQVDKIIETLPLNPLKINAYVSTRQLNSLRSIIDNRFLGSAKWLNESTVEKTAGLKTAANIMRGIVQGTDDKLPGLFDRLANSVTAIRSLKSELAKPHIMTNLIELSLSGALGGITGGISPDGVKNALFTYGVTKAALSTPVRTALAKSISGLGTPGITRQITGTVAKTLIPGISGKIANQ